MVSRLEVRGKFGWCDRSHAESWEITSEEWFARPR
jgi:hypothetical protein